MDTSASWAVIRLKLRVQSCRRAAIRQQHARRHHSDRNTHEVHTFVIELSTHCFLTLTSATASRRCLNLLSVLDKFKQALGFVTKRWAQSCDFRVLQNVRGTGIMIRHQTAEHKCSVTVQVNLLSKKLQFLLYRYEMNDDRLNGRAAIHARANQ
jgi:hypothetical protein